MNDLQALAGEYARTVDRIDARIAELREQDKTATGQDHFDLLYRIGALRTEKIEALSARALLLDAAVSMARHGEKHPWVK